MTDADRFDPVDYYSLSLKGKAETVATELFDKKLKDSKVDEPANEQLYRKLTRAREQHKEETRRENNFKTWRAVVLVLCILFFFAAVIGIVLLAADSEKKILGISLTLTIAGLVLGIGFIVLLTKYFAPRMQAMEEAFKRRAKDIDQMAAQCREQVAPLANQFRWDDIYQVFDKTTEMFRLDRVLDSKKFGLLEDLYEYSDLAMEPTTSVLGVVSGSIATNPFIKVKILSQTMYDCPYTGSITISWTTTHYDSEGHLHTDFHTQVLTATTYHPAPQYGDMVYTIYGNEAAPGLRFTRTAKDLDYSDSKAVEKFVKSEEKEMRKRSEESVSQGNGRGFTPMHNTRFEALWGAYDRNNEVEFRLLFTPLAQQNMEEVLSNKNKDGYGDDFNFYKVNKINIVCSNHAQGMGLFNPELYESFERIADVRENFIQLMTTKFKSLYFDLAPILAIPLYQMTDAGDYEYSRRAPDSISDYEAMEMVNQFSESFFEPEGAATKQIRRVVYQGTKGKTDSFQVVSRAFSRHQEVEHVTKVGGDGLPHVIPIQYYVYDPVERKRDISIRRMGDVSLRRDYRGKLKSSIGDRTYLRHKSLLGLLVDCYNDEDEARFESLFEKEETAEPERS